MVTQGGAGAGRRGEEERRYGGAARIEFPGQSWDGKVGHLGEDTDRVRSPCAWEEEEPRLSVLKESKEVGGVSGITAQTKGSEGRQDPPERISHLAVLEPVVRGTRPGGIPDSTMMGHLF